MNTTPNLKVQLEPVVDRKSVHFPSAKSLVLLRNQVSHDEMIVDASNGNKDDETEIRHTAEHQKTLPEKLFSVVSFSIQSPWKFIQTRPWLSGVCAMSVVLVYLVVILPGQNQNDDGLDSLDLDFVTKYPDFTNQTVDKELSHRTLQNPILPASGERTSKTAQPIGTQFDGDKNVVVDKNSSLQPSPTATKNLLIERTVTSHTQDGAWLTGKIEIGEGETTPQTVRIKTTPKKKHRIVLRPRIRK